MQKILVVISTLAFTFGCATTNLSTDNYLECKTTDNKKITTKTSFKDKNLVSFAVHTYDSNLSDSRWVAYSGVYKTALVKGLDQKAKFYVQRYDFLASTRKKDCYTVGCTKEKMYLDDNKIYNFSLDRTYLTLSIRRLSSSGTFLESITLNCEIIDSKRFYEVRDIVWDSVKVKKTEYEERLDRIRAKRKI